jgi:tRNA 2-selenouridine synthase SelU
MEQKMQPRASVPFCMYLFRQVAHIIFIFTSLEERENRYNIIQKYCHEKKFVLTR